MVLKNNMVRRPEVRRAAHHPEGLATRWLESWRRRTIWRVPIGYFETSPRFHFDSKWKGIALSLQKKLRLEPRVVYLHRNRALRTAIADARCLLQESTLALTKCTELVSGWPGYVGTKDASKHGVGGCIVDNAKACVPTVFRVEWPEDIKAGRSGVQTQPEGTHHQLRFGDGGIVIVVPCHGRCM